MMHHSKMLSLLIEFADVDKDFALTVLQMKIMVINSSKDKNNLD